MCVPVQLCVEKERWMQPQWPTSGSRTNRDFSGRANRTFSGFLFSEPPSARSTQSPSILALQFMHLVCGCTTFSRTVLIQTYDRIWGCLCSRPTVAIRIHTHDPNMTSSLELIHSGLSPVSGNKHRALSDRLDHKFKALRSRNTDQSQIDV